MLKTASTTISKPAIYLAIAASAATLLFLICLHILSPEFDPAWRMVSEYANGNYGWVLSLMFASWGISSWALAYGLRSQVNTTGGRVGLIFLILAGIGEFMASIFDINHGLHEAASFLGIPGLAIAAMLISKSLVKDDIWARSKKSLLWTANLTWVSIVLMAATFAILIFTFMQTGIDMPTDSTTVTTLPDGVIALVGWANRFLILVYTLWVVNTARLTLKRTV